MIALVTGASGFIGSRLVERLLARGAEVRALVRDRLRERPAGMRGAAFAIGDVMLPESLLAAARGANVLFHCAHGGDEREAAWAVNVDGTLNVLEAARAAGIRRLVHLSSWRVHGRRLPPSVHEGLPLVTQGIPYDVSKAEAERRATVFARQHGLELVTLRPTLVYGPRCQPWVVGLVERLKAGRLLLVRRGEGLANLVYVDDVVEAMILAATRDGVADEAFLISGARPVPWRDYLEGLSALAGVPLPPSAARPAALVAAAERWRFRFTRRDPSLTPADVALFGERSAPCIDKARARLGYEPRTDLAAGLEAVRVFLEAEGLIGARRGEPRAGALDERSGWLGLAGGSGANGGRSPASGDVARAG